VANSFTDDTLQYLIGWVPAKVWRPTRPVTPIQPVDVQNRLLKLQANVLPPTADAATASPAGAPKQLLSVTASQEPSKQQDRTFSQVFVAFTRDSTDAAFDHVNVWFKGYKGNTNPVLMTSGTDSPITFLCEATQETVVVSVQPVSASGIAANLDSALTASVQLTGVVAHPPAPTLSQSLVSTPVGYQFTFTQVVLPAGTQDVIDSYKSYRNTSFTTAGATVIRTYKHDQTNAGASIVVQDSAVDGSIYFYWVSAVNSIGLESTLTAAQSGTVVASIPMTMKGAPVVLAPLVPSNALTNGGGLGQWVAGQAVTLPGSIDFDVFSTGGIIDVLLWASTGGTGPNGYLLRFDARMGHPAGQILKITNGTWANIGTAQAANNAVVLSGWHTITARYTGQGQFDIFVDGVWNTTAVDTTFIPTGATYYGYEVTSGSTLAPPAFLGKTQDHLPDGSTYLRTPQYAASAIVLDNPSFELSGSIPPVGWTVRGTPTISYDISTPYAGNQSVRIQTTALDNGLVSTRKYTCRPGDQIFLAGRVKCNSGQADLYLSYRSIAGGGTGTSEVQTASGSWTQIQVSGTVPAGTAYFEISLTSFTATADIEFDEIYCKFISQLDTEVADGTTYGKVNQTALTSNNVDPSKGGFLTKGSTPVSLSGLALNGMTWATPAPASQNTAEIDFSWTQTPIFRADGSLTGFVATGTQAVTGLIASQAYTAYPYFDELTQSMKWVSSELVFPTITGVTLNGSTGFIQTATGGTHPDIGATGQYTLEFWINSTSAANQGLMSFSAPQGSGAHTAMQVQLVLTSAGEIKFSYANSSAAIKTVTTTGAGLLDGAWHHIVITFATGGTIAIYVDTVSKGTGSALGAQGTAGATCWWHIGFADGTTGWPVTTNTFLNGKISNVAIYSGAPLTTAQISNHFVTGINIGFAVTHGYHAIVIAETPIAPTYFWKLNETSGTTATESISGTNAGTYSGGFTLNQQAPVVVPSGSPAYMWPYKNFLCSQAQALQNRIPLSAGSLTPSTTAVGGTGGSGGGGGGGGGGQGGCWSGNTLVKTPDGPRRMDEWIDGTAALTAAGTWKPATLKKHKSRRWKMLDPMSNGEFVTTQHNILTETGWKRAHLAFPESQTFVVEACSYDLTVDVAESESQILSSTTEHSYTLESGIVAHNFLPK
jgi:hypothetical protein